MRSRRRFARCTDARTHTRSCPATHVGQSVRTLCESRTCLLCNHGIDFVVVARRHALVVVLAGGRGGGGGASRVCRALLLLMLLLRHQRRRACKRGVRGAKCRAVRLRRDCSPHRFVFEPRRGLQTGHRAGRGCSIHTHTQHSRRDVHDACRKEQRGGTKERHTLRRERGGSSRGRRRRGRGVSRRVAHKRCTITGRPRSYMKKFGLSRIAFRELALEGKIPGVTKASW